MTLSDFPDYSDIKRCLGLRDFEEIQKKGITAYPQSLKSKSIFGWKSVITDDDGNQFVPCLFVRFFGEKAQIRIDWIPLEQELYIYAEDITLLFHFGIMGD